MVMVFYSLTSKVRERPTGIKQGLLCVLRELVIAEHYAPSTVIFSNNIKNGISDMKDIKRRIMACP